MHCPRCGSIATSGQPFCRGCGLSLEKIAELLGEELGAPPPKVSDEVARLRELQQKHENWGGIAAMTAGGVILLLFVILVFTQMILKAGLLIIPAALLILLALGVGVMIYFQASAKSLKDKFDNTPSRKVEAGSGDAELLMPPSITDRTTELLRDRPSPSTRELKSPR